MRHVSDLNGSFFASFSFVFLIYFSSFLFVVDGLQVQYFSASTTCTGTVTTMVYPVGSSTGGNCYPLLNTYLSQALQLYNLGLGSFKPTCMFITPTNPGVPGKVFDRSKKTSKICPNQSFFFLSTSVPGLSEICPG